jgi:thioredoxin domain-containing protein 5
LCSEQEVTGYPTLKFFNKGQSESVKFRGTRDLPSLTNFINEQLGIDKVVGGDDESTNDSLPQIPDAGHKLIELTEDTFAKHVASGKHFVKFYAPW